MSGGMKLTYFDIRARAEPTRLLFKLAGKEFTDSRVAGEEWQKFKPSTPKGQIPVLEVDGKMMCESNAIARFVAREYSLYGANNWEAAVIDMIFDSVATIFESVVLQKMGKTDEVKSDARKKMDSNLESLEKLVVQLKKGKFILGDKASLADTMLYSAVEFMQSVVADFKCDSYATVAEVAKSFSEIPSIADWIKNRPKNSM